MGNGINLRLAFTKYGDAPIEYRELSGQQNKFFTQDGGKPYIEEICNISKDNPVLVISCGRRYEIFQDKTKTLAVLPTYVKGGFFSRLFGLVFSQILIFRLLIRFKPDFVGCIDCGTNFVTPFIYSFFYKAKFLPIIPGQIGGSHFGGKFLSRLFFALLRSSRTNRVLVRAEFLRKQLVKEGVQESIISTYFPVYDKSFFKIEDVGPVMESSIFRIIFVGRLAKVKGIFDLLEICKQVTKHIKDVQFIVIGTGPQLSKIKHALEQEQLKKSMLLLGYQRHEKIYSYMKKSDALIIPSYAEGICKVAWEGILSEIPIIASKVGGLRDLITDGETGYLCAPGETREFAQKILEIYRDRALLKQIKSNLKILKQELLKPKPSLEDRVTQYIKEQEWFVIS